MSQKSSARERIIDAAEQVVLMERNRGSRPCTCPD